MVSYYERAADDLAPRGWIRKPVDYVIIIDKNGEFVSAVDLREANGKKLVGKPTLLPNIGKQAQKHTNAGTDANLLWDDAPFILGLKTKGDISREAFCRTVVEFFPDGGGYDDDEGVRAIKTFCRTQLPDETVRARIVASLPKKDDALLPVITAFRLDGDVEQDGKFFISDRDAVKQRLAVFVGDQAPDAICCVTGESASISRLHTVIKNVWGGQSSGVSLVSYNAAAFNSYNKKDGENAPVGDYAMFAYTTALNHLLGPGSKQRMQVGDASTVFWSEKPTRLEGVFAELFTEPAKDDPGRQSELVHELRDAITTGSRPELDATTRFYVLGLSPNAARAAVRFWIVDTVAAMGRNILRHFDDTRIVHGPNERDEIPFFHLLKQTAIQQKGDNIPPNLGGEVMESIMRGTPYPLTALTALLRRTRAECSERSVPYFRAAFIKACINRSPLQEQEKKELTVSLDKTNTNIGYLLGRLFATLEKLQMEAQGSVNAGIRDRFYGSASSTPAAVFPTIQRTSKHHLKKVSRPGFFEKLIGEIMDKFQDFPEILSLLDQGRFSIGYYHQMQDFYTKKPDQIVSEAAAQA